MLHLRGSIKVTAAAAIGITLLLIAGCLETIMAKSALMMPDAAQTKAAVLEYVPIGTQIEQANPSYSPYEAAAITLRTRNVYAHAAPGLAGPHFKPYL